MRELFVWYRVAPARAQAAKAAVIDMQSALAIEMPGLEARLLVRSPPGADLQTWMEIYARPGGIDAAAEEVIDEQARALGPFIEGARHPEAFEPTA